jgi:hypothetical protein
MVARNFLEEDANILYPRVDFGGEKPGITGMEFPLLNYFIYLFSLVFGYAHWYGRLINLFISTIGLWYFYKLIRSFLDERHAFYSTFLILLSVWLTYSRKIMPDTFSMAFIFIGFYHVYNYMKKEKGVISLLLFLVFTSAGVLSKLPSGYCLVFLLPFFIDRNVLLTRKVLVSLSCMCILAASGAYYFYWVPYLKTTFGIDHFFMGKSFTDGFTEIITHAGEASQKFYEAALGFSGFILFIPGVILALLKKQKTVLFILIAGLCSFLIIILKGGFAFYHHRYYIIPFVPVMAVCAAFTLTNIKQKAVLITMLCVFSLESILTNFADFHVNPEFEAVASLENVLDKHYKKTDLILINSGNVPTPLYFAHRKGWIEFNERLGDKPYVNSLKEKGLRCIVITKNVFGKNIDLDYPILYEDKDFKIYSL